MRLASILKTVGTKEPWASSWGARLPFELISPRVTHRLEGTEAPARRGLAPEPTKELRQHDILFWAERRPQGDTGHATLQ